MASSFLIDGLDIPIRMSADGDTQVSGGLEEIIENVGCWEFANLTLWCGHDTGGGFGGEAEFDLAAVVSQPGIRVVAHHWHENRQGQVVRNQHALLLAGNPELGEIGRQITAMTRQLRNSPVIAGSNTVNKPDQLRRAISAVAAEETHGQSTHQHMHTIMYEAVLRQSCVWTTLEDIIETIRRETALGYVNPAQRWIRTLERSAELGDDSWRRQRLLAAKLLASKGNWPLEQIPQMVEELCA